MCVVSMVAEHYRQKWPDPTPYTIYNNWPRVSREEFDALKAQVDEMVSLLKKAKEYDARTGQPDCENEAKMAVLRKVAELVGVDLDASL